MRTLIVNSMFANSFYRRCADELGAIGNLDLTMLTVDEWRTNGKPMPLDEIAVNSPYRTVVGHAGWKGFENRGFYTSGIVRAFKQSQPEVLFLMEEPFSVFAAQILSAKALLAPNIPVVFFTWNNLSLDRFDYRPSAFYRSVAKWSLQRMDYALTANSDGISVLREAGFTKPAKTIGYGVDTAAYTHRDDEAVAGLRAQLAIGPDDIVIGYVGRLIKMKGVDLLIRSFSELVAEQPQAKLKLLLLGGGEEEQALLSAAAQAGVQDLVRHVAVVPQREVPNYMHLLDVLVLPSRRQGMWAEQFGRVIIEAMAAGKIVIGSSSGAIPEVIGDAGFVFAEEDHFDLLRKLKNVLQMTPEEVQAVRTKAIDRATNGYSWNRFAKDAFDAIEFSHQAHNGLTR